MRDGASKKKLTSFGTTMHRPHIKHVMPEFIAGHLQQ